MVLHPGNCCYMTFGCNPDNGDLILEDSTKIPSAEEYVILGVTIDNRLKNLFKKKANKLNALICAISESKPSKTYIQLIF